MHLIMCGEAIFALQRSRKKIQLLEPIIEWARYDRLRDGTSDAVIFRYWTGSGAHVTRMS